MASRAHRVEMAQVRFQHASKREQERCGRLILRARGDVGFDRQAGQEVPRNIAAAKRTLDQTATSTDLSLCAGFPNGLCYNCGQTRFNHNSAAEWCAMATLDDDGWELDNAEEMHAEHPDQFHIPTRAERASLQMGARVKLVFLILTKEDGEPIIQGERMWCTIQEVDGGRYAGILESQPASSGCLQPGDRIEFGPEHVVTVLVPRTDPRHPDYVKT